MSEQSEKESRSTNQALIDAWRKANDSWMPVNPRLLKEIRAGLAQGTYERNLELLVSDLKSDLSLFTYCVKRLSEMVKPGEKEPSSPQALFEQAGTSGIQDVISEAAELLSPETFSELDAVQAARLQETLTSAAAVEHLSNAEGIEPLLGYSSGVMRQLGLALVAWNYPHLYAQAMAQIKEEVNADQVFNRVLGFSPQVLGIAFARKWNLLPELRAAVGDEKALEDCDEAAKERVEQVGATLEKLCEVGECLARAQHPELYPSARSDWMRAKHEVESRIGLDGLSTIFEQAKKYCHHYEVQAPEVFVQHTREELAERFENASPEVLLQDNRYIFACAKGTQYQLRELYKTLPEEGPGAEQIKLLARQVMPNAGFTRGCIYVFDPETLLLMPRLSVGESTLNEFKPVDPSPAAAEEDHVVWAYRSEQLVVRSHKLDDPTHVTICGSYGRIQRAGVLVLESDPEYFQAEGGEPREVFEAMRNSLMACLRLF